MPTGLRGLGYQTATALAFAARCVCGDIRRVLSNEI
jgi:hypothetical protein